MKQLLAIGTLSLLILSACASENAAPKEGSGLLGDPNTATGSAGSQRPRVTLNSGPGTVMASVGGVQITLEQLAQPLIEAHGLNVLLQLIELEMAKQRASEAGVVVTDADVTAERQRMLESLFKTSLSADDPKLTEQQQAEARQRDYERLLPQLLETQHLSQQEFDIVIRTTAYLRKLAVPWVEPQLTEEALRTGFNIEYGERVHVRRIQLRNLREWADVKKRLDEGASFAKVAAETSRDEESRKYGGELRPFSRADPMVPDAFKNAAFALKTPMEISDAIQAGGTVEVIQLIEKIPPSAVKYEDHRVIVANKLRELLLTVRINQLRAELLDSMKKAMVIDDPVLSKQYADRLARAAGQTGTDPAQIRQQIENDHPASPTTQPAGTVGRATPPDANAPSTPQPAGSMQAPMPPDANGPGTTQPTAPIGDVTAPPGHAEVARPPATMPGH